MVIRNTRRFGSPLFSRSKPKASASIHRSAWKAYSKKLDFRFTAFSEVRIYRVVRSSFSERVSHYPQRARGVPCSEGSGQDAQHGRDAVEVPFYWPRGQSVSEGRREQRHGDG